MQFREYSDLFNQIVSTENPKAPYDNPSYINYVKLNQSRMARWIKTMELERDLVDVLKEIEKPQHWIIISEPWCGDAAHCIPFLIEMAEKSSRLSYEIQLRDSEPFLIDRYLTAGGKSIPKLIARDRDGTDLFTWGPRPFAAQEIYHTLKSEGAHFDEITLKLQSWYNSNKGQDIQKELLVLISMNRM